MTTDIRVQVEGGVLDLEIARPDKKNALTHAMYTSLADALERAGKDGSVRVVLIHGSDTCFTAGNDLRDFLETPPTGFDSPVFRFIKGASVFEKPLVVAVEGAAVGIGTTLLLHADLAVAGDGSTFQMPFVNLGVCPEAASSLLLPRIMGHVRAARLLLLCDAFSADEARDVGLINEVVGSGNAFARARELAETVAAKPPSAVRLAKALMRRSVEADIADTIAFESRAFIERVESVEAKEAMTAFFEKRLPRFQSVRMSFRDDYITEAVHFFREYKALGDRAMAQVDDDGFFASLDDENNSIALVVKHMSGNMRSRWTDFLTADGEKPDRHRDEEFVIDGDTRSSLIAAWEAGWQLLFDAAGSLSADDLERDVTIRGQKHTILKAVNRQLTHYAYHVGQIVLLAKHAAGEEWESLSVPRGKSEDFNADMQERYGDWNKGTS